MYRGGEEVLLDVGGQDSTEAFEDVGHSDEAREILDGLLVGNLKRQVRHPPTPQSRTYNPIPTSSLHVHATNPPDVSHICFPRPQMPRAEAGPRVKELLRNDSAHHARKRNNPLSVHRTTILTTEKQEGDPKPKSYAQPGTTATTTDGASTGVGLYAIILLGGALAFAAYTMMNKQSSE